MNIKVFRKRGSFHLWWRGSSCLVVCWSFRAELCWQRCLERPGHSLALLLRHLDLLLHPPLQGAHTARNKTVKLYIFLSVKSQTFISKSRFLLNLFNFYYKEWLVIHQISSGTRIRIRFHFCSGFQVSAGRE